MAAKLRLARFGKRGHPSYRLVVIDEHKKRDGRAVEVLGNYDPKDPDNKINFDKDRVSYWLSVGAKPTPTVKHLLKI